MPEIILSSKGSEDPFREKEYSCETNLFKTDDYHRKLKKTKGIVHIQLASGRKCRIASLRKLHSIITPCLSLDRT